MSVVLTPGQLACALKHVKHPLADTMTQALWDIMQTMGAMLEAHTASGQVEGYTGSGVVRTAPAEVGSTPNTWGDEMMIGFVAVNPDEHMDPVPFFLEGMDDEGWDNG